MQTCRVLPRLLAYCIASAIWCGMAAPSDAATAHVQKCQGVAFGASTVSCSLTGVGVGNAISVGVYWNDATGTLSSVTMSTCTGTITLYDNGQNDGGTAYASSGAVFNLGVGGSCTFTANFSEVMDEAKIWVHEISGLGNGTIANHLADSDQFRNTTCTDCIPDVAGQLAITPTVDGAYFFGMCVSAASPTLTAGTDFTIGSTDSSRGIVEYYIQPTAASHATTCSRSDTTGANSIALALVLQPAASSIPSSFYRRRIQ